MIFQKETEMHIILAGWPCRRSYHLAQESGPFPTLINLLCFYGITLQVDDLASFFMHIAKLPAVS